MKRDIRRELTVLDRVARSRDNPGIYGTAILQRVRAYLVMRQVYGDHVPEPELTDAGRFTGLLFPNEPAPVTPVRKRGRLPIPGSAAPEVVHA